MSLSSTFAAIRALWGSFSPDLRAETITLITWLPATLVLATLMTTALPGA